MDRPLRSGGRRRPLGGGGTKSPAFLATALDALATTLPHARRIDFPGLGHSGPDDDGAPERVGSALREFFSA